MNPKSEIRNSKSVLDRRRAGVLLHPTSLPGAGAHGDLGAEAWRFADFLAAAGLSVWQMLPLGPTHADRSPYHSRSVHALDPALLSGERLAARGWLEPEHARRPAAEIVARCREGFERHAEAAVHAEWQRFCAEEAGWLEDYALYVALRAEQRERPWWEWEPALRAREPQALAAAGARLAEPIARVRFEQFLLARQFRELRAHCAERGVALFGDLPIFVAHDSADVWARPHCFRLDESGRPVAVAGVPPDYFSATGQHWGNPLYDWERMQAEGFRWWIERLATELRRFDLLRVDHFRGFQACWEIPASAPTAVEGRWIEVPGEALFDALLARFGRLPLVAEDLGLITPEVHALRRRYRLPGMRVLQFAFDSDADNPYLPHNHERDSVIYTGTHDNDTTLAWFQALPAAQQLRVVEYLGYPHEPMPRPLVRAALASVAYLAVIPMQDLLGLGRGHRMNTPGTAAGNWRWRFGWDQIGPDAVGGIRRMVEMYGRDASGFKREA